MSNTCEICKNDIRVQCFKGTGVCSTNCEKAREKKRSEREFAIAS